MNETLSSNNFREDSDKLGNTLSKAEISNLKEFIKDKRDQEIEAVYNNTNTELEDLITKEYWYANQNLLQEKGYTVGDLQYALNKKLGLDNSVGFASSPGEYDYLGGHGNADKLVTDNVFGKNTFLKLIQFQRENGLTVDGLSGPQTQAKLFEGIKKTELPSEHSGGENIFFARNEIKTVSTGGGTLRNLEGIPVKTGGTETEYSHLGINTTVGGNPLAGLGDVLGGLFGRDRSNERGNNRISIDINDRYIVNEGIGRFLGGQMVILQSGDNTIWKRNADGSHIGDEPIRNDDNIQVMLTGKTSGKYFQVVDSSGELFYVYNGSVESLTDNNILLARDSARRLGISEKLVNAILKQESRGNMLATRFEKHVYNRYINKGVSTEEAMLLSTSFGGFQIMGFNYKNCGYGNVHSFVEAMKEPKNQFLAFERFVKATPPLHTAMKLDFPDFSTIAYYYNGPAYSRNGYDEKIERNYYA